MYPAVGRFYNPSIEYSSPSPQFTSARSPRLASSLEFESSSSSSSTPTELLENGYYTDESDESGGQSAYSLLRSACYKHRKSKQTLDRLLEKRIESLRDCESDTEAEAAIRKVSHSSSPLSTKPARPAHSNEFDLNLAGRKNEPMLVSPRRSKPGPVTVSKRKSWTDSGVSVSRASGGSRDHSCVRERHIGEARDTKDDVTPITTTAEVGGECEPGDERTQLMSRISRLLEKGTIYESSDAGHAASTTSVCSPSRRHNIVVSNAVGDASVPKMCPSVPKIRPEKKDSVSSRSSTRQIHFEPPRAQSDDNSVTWMRERTSPFEQHSDIALKSRPEVATSVGDEELLEFCRKYNERPRRTSTAGHWLVPKVTDVQADDSDLQMEVRRRSKVHTVQTDLSEVQLNARRCAMEIEERNKENRRTLVPGDDLPDAFIEENLTRTPGLHYDTSHHVTSDSSAQYLSDDVFMDNPRRVSTYIAPSPVEHTRSSKRRVARVSHSVKQRFLNIRGCLKKSLNRTRSPSTRDCSDEFLYRRVNSTSSAAPSDELFPIGNDSANVSVLRNAYTAEFEFGPTPDKQPSRDLNPPSRKFQLGDLLRKKRSVSASHLSRDHISKRCQHKSRDQKSPVAPPLVSNKERPRSMFEISVASPRNLACGDAARTRRSHSPVYQSPLPTQPHPLDRSRSSHTLANPVDNRACALSECECNECLYREFVEFVRFRKMRHCVSTCHVTSTHGSGHVTPVHESGQVTSHSSSPSSRRRSYSAPRMNELSPRANELLFKSLNGDRIQPLQMTSTSANRRASTVRTPGQEIF